MTLFPTRVHRCPWSRGRSTPPSGPACRFRPHPRSRPAPEREILDQRPDICFMPKGFGTIRLSPSAGRFLAISDTHLLHLGERWIGVGQEVAWLFDGTLGADDCQLPPNGVWVIGVLARPSSVLAVIYVSADTTAKRAKKAVRWRFVRRR